MTWGDLFAKHHSLLKNIESQIELRMKNGEPILPHKWGVVYRAFNLTPLNKVKVVILGQDPYPNPINATGLAFSVNRKINLPKSLVNIYKALENDLGVIRESGNLTDWAKQGVLLLNTCLTVRQGCPGSHQNLGWTKFTDSVILEVSKKGNVVFMLWGKKAQEKASLVDEKYNLILEAPHPSPLSAYRGFFDCGHFSKANDFLGKGLEVVWDEQ